MNMDLWTDQFPYALGTEHEERPTITCYLLPDEAGREAAPAVIVFPGGGYTHRADHEGEPIARWLNTLGIHAFVLNYRVAPYRHPAPLTDAQRAIRTVRARAAEWHIDPRRIGILGFSAGGHLASTAGTHFDHGQPEAEDPIERMSSRPDFMILCYPVITMGDYTHEGSRENLLGPDADPELVESLSNERQVTPETPPTFIWHTSDDGAVPVENALLFAGALSRAKVSFELHSFMSGRHGLGLAEDHPEAYVWTELCERWMRKLGVLGLK